jgi:hypothetical protein
MASPRRASVNPPWTKVIATTLQLWIRRRVLHVPDSGSARGSRRRRRLVPVVAAVVVAAAGVTTGVALTSHSTPAARRAPARPKLTPAQVAVRQADQQASQASEKLAAAWIASQIAPGSVIGCDPATCAAILQAGYRTAGQIVLQPGVSLPGPGSVIVASGTVRGQDGSELAASAPAIIAVFGTGAQSVQVRVATAGGAQAYGQAASAALAARQKAGKSLLVSRRVHAVGGTRRDIAAGRIDPRLTSALRRLASHYSVSVVRLADAGPTAAGNVPYRMAEVVVPVIRAGRHHVSALGGMEKLLRQLPGAVRPSLTTTRLGGGRRAIEIFFPAPTPV